MAKKRKVKKTDDVFEIPDTDFLEQEESEEEDQEAIKRYIG